MKNLVNASVLGLMLFAAPAAEAADVTLLYNASVRAEIHDCGCKSRPLGGLARRAAMIEDISNDSRDVLLLDGGNLLGDPTRDSFAESEFVARETAAMGYAAVGVGAYELGQGIDAVRTIAASSGLTFVSANVQVDGDRAFEPWIVVERGGVKFGVISVLDPEYDRPPYNKNVDGLEIIDPVAALERELPRLQKKCDVVVLLSNMEKSDGTVGLLRALDGRAEIDLVIEGAVARQYANPRKLGDALVLAANAQGKYLGQLDLTIEVGTIGQATGEIHFLDLDLPEQKDLARRVEDFESKQEAVATSR
jgi:2',3'-cyclic-nucleotide 2'-phosphodiesterase (5'-nucleotidase family)